MDALTLPERIRRAYSRMGESQQQLAHYILTHPTEVAFLTSTRLGERVSVSESTVVRFARILGFDGYPEMQADIQESLRRLVIASENPVSGASEAKMAGWARQLEVDRKNLGETYEGLTHDAMELAIQLLDDARRIYVMGSRSSYALAFLAAHLLQPVLRKVHLLDQTGGTLPDQVIDLGKGDVLLSFVTPRYTPQTVQTFRYARECGAKTISVTDSVLSPTADGADVVLPFGHHSLSFFNSILGAVAVVNALVVGVTQLQKNDNLIRSLEESHHRWEGNLQ